MIKKLFCDECLCEQEIARITKRNQEFFFKGETFIIDHEESVCTVCGNVVYDKELGNQTMKKVTDLYYINQIQNVRKQYGFTQELFAKIMNWGIATLKRYETKKSTPDSTHLTIIKMLKNNPETIVNFYNETKDIFTDDERREIETKISRNTKDNVQLNKFLIDLYQNYSSTIVSGWSKFNPEKLIHMILYFSSHGVLKTKLMKLLWYADFYNFKIYEYSISGTPYWKLQHGPVPIKHNSLLSYLEDTLNFIDIEREIVFLENVEFTKHTVIAKEPFDKTLFAEQELFVLNHIEESFRNLGAVSISNQSHEEEGWLKTRIKEPISYRYATSLRIK